MSNGSLSSEETLVGDETIGGSRPRRRPTSLERGSTVGRYVVLQQLGVGGMGVVHAAYDPELDRAVALKVLVPREGEADDETASQRLLREAQAMARLNHPNVVAVHDVGMHEGRVFVAMELVEGQTLTQWLQQAERTPQQILEVFVQAGRGLASAHAKGLVHRDFKPDNVMIGRGDGSPRAQVMDFGLARAAETADAPPTVSGDGEDDEEEEEAEGDPMRPPSRGFADDLTRVGQVVGTPRFMAPEQHLRGEVDTRTDQFAFCVALWLALFDQHPFGGETGTELAARVIAGEVTEPPAVPGVGASLRKALKTGLSPERAQRWPSMDALLDELERDPSRTRKRVIAGLAAVTVLAGLVGTERLLHARTVQACEDAGAAIEQTLGPKAREPAREGLLATGLPQAETTWAQLGPWLDAAQQGWATARTDACLAAEVDDRWEPERYAAAVECLDGQRRAIEALMPLLAQADRDTLYEAIPIAADLPPASLCTDPRYLAYQPPVADDLAERQEQHAIQDELARARLLMRTNRFDEARELMRELEPRLETLEPGPLQVEGLRLRAWLHETEVHFDLALATRRDAFARALSLGTVHQARALAFELAELTDSQLADYTTADWWLDVADSLSQRIGQGEHGTATLRSLHARARLAAHQGDFTRSLTLAEQALAEAERTLGPNHPELASVTTTLATSHRELGHYEVATSQARRTVALSEAALGPLHPQVLAATQVLAETLRQTGDHDEALAVQRRALEIAKSVLAPGHPSIANTETNLSLILQELGRTEEALIHVQAGIQTLEAVHGPDHPDLTRSYINLGNIQQTLGDYEGAATNFRRASESAKVHDYHRAHAVALVNLGNTLQLMGDSEAAIETLQQALAVLEEVDGPEHARVGQTLINVAMVQSMLDRYEDALASFQRSLAILEKALGPDHPDVAFVLVGMADLQRTYGHPKLAVPLAERALEIREAKTVPPIHLAQARWTLARALEASGGSHERALALAKQALPVFETDPDNEALELVREYLGVTQAADG